MKKNFFTLPCRFLLRWSASVILALTLLAGASARAGETPIVVPEGGNEESWLPPAGELTMANPFEVRRRRWLVEDNPAKGFGPRDLTLTGSVALNQGNDGEVVTRRNLTVAGPLTGMGGLTKGGDSALVLGAGATYPGPTKVAAGTLYVDGSLSGPGAVGVTSGALLGGVGQIAGIVTLNDASVLVAGRRDGGSGTLTVGGLVLNGRSLVKLGLQAPDQPVNGGLQVNGDLVLAGTLSLRDAGGLAAGDYTLMRYTGDLKDLGAHLTVDPGFAGSLLSDTPGRVVVRVVRARALAPRDHELLSRSDFTALRWEADPQAAGGYDVYLGPDAAAVASAVRTSPEVYRGHATDGTHTPAGPLPASGAMLYWRVDALRADGSVLAAGPVWSFIVADDRDLHADTWVATDALGRTLPTNLLCGPPRPDRPTGIFYFLWHNPGELGDDGPRDNTAYIDARGGYTNPANPWADNPPWMDGGNGRSWYWGKPEHGYYASDDEWVIRRHISQLTAAGVDVIAFDNTNGHPHTYQRNYTAIAETIRKMRTEGTRVDLKFLFVTHGGAGGSVRTMTWLYENFYRPGLYPELWFYWQGKPAIIGYPDGLKTGETPVSDEVRNFFTIRAGWANRPDSVNEWQWIDTPTPQDHGYLPARPDIAEQLAVACGGWANGNLGRSNLNRKQPAFDKFHLPVGRTEGQGLFFAEQMFYGLKYDPQFLFVTGWNEWWAGAWNSSVDNGPALLTSRTAKGKRYFVDNYNAEYSRDIEPMAGGFGDNYYYQFVAANRQRKGVHPIPAASTPKAINVGGDFADWTDVGPEFLDVAGDVDARDHPGTFKNMPNYTNTAGRNDFRVLKVARDRDFLYFYAETTALLTPHTDPHWMTLFINADRRRATGWEGYDYVVDFDRSGAATTTLYRLGGNNWNPVRVRADLPYKVSGNKLMLRVARADLGLAAEPVAFDFHWADNYHRAGDVAEFSVNGDSAPDRRFDYRYQTWTDEAVVLRRDNFENGRDPSWGDTFQPGGRWQISTQAPYGVGQCLVGTGASDLVVGGAAVNRTATSGATSLRIDFRYKLNNVKDAQNVQVSYLNKDNVWVKVRNLGRDEYHPQNQAWGYDEKQNLWLLFQDERLNDRDGAAFFHDHFAVKIDLGGLTDPAQTVSVDDFEITATRRTIPPGN